MYGLIRSLENVRAGAKDETLDREQLESLMTDVVQAVTYHVSNSHISVTYPDGSVGRKEARWDPEEQRFIDWGNNFWLYGPESFRGHMAGKKWVLDARHNREVIVESILNRAAHATKFDRVDRLWNFYWQLMLQDVMQNSEGERIDLHINPLNVSELAPKPEPVCYQHSRERDYILV